MIIILIFTIVISVMILILIFTIVISVMILILIFILVIIAVVNVITIVLHTPRQVQDYPFMLPLGKLTKSDGKSPSL